MQISLLDSFSRRIGTVAIAGYQKHISPHKGFACAHRVLYGGESCSQYLKRVIAQEGLSSAWGKSRTRFQDCREANLVLRSAQMKWRRSQIESPEPTDDQEEDISSDPSQQKSRRVQGISNFTNNNSNCSDCSDFPDCSILDCVSADCHSPDCSGAHCHVPDCSSLDCSGADCSSLDCGSSDCGSLDCGGCGS